MSSSSFSGAGASAQLPKPCLTNIPLTPRATLAGILLVDDDATTNFLNEQILRRLQLSDCILVAEDGEHALAVLAQLCAEREEACPVLVLLDLQMPRMNGIEFLEAYQVRPPAPPLTIVALTTSINPHDLSRLRHFSPAEVLEKPLTEEKVLGLVRRYFPQLLVARE